MNESNSLTKNEYRERLNAGYVVADETANDVKVMVYQRLARSPLSSIDIERIAESLHHDVRTTLRRVTADALRELIRR